MTASDAPYPPKPVLVASERPTARGVSPAMWLAAVSLVALFTGSGIGAFAAAIGAIVFALRARRELRADDSLSGSLRSLVAMIVGVAVAAAAGLSTLLPFIASAVFIAFG